MLVARRLHLLSEAGRSMLATGGVVESASVRNDLGFAFGRAALTECGDEDAAGIKEPTASGGRIHVGAAG